MNYAIQHKDIFGYPGYSVGSDGTILSFKSKEPKALKQYVNKKGYLYVLLYTGKKSTYCRVHRLVAQAFIPNPDNKLEVNHKDGVKTNNHVSNLEWATHKENIDHALDNDLYPMGSKHYSAKLTESQVAYIKTLLSDGVYQKTIARDFGVTEATISYIAAGRSWKHVK